WISAVAVALGVCGTVTLSAQRSAPSPPQPGLATASSVQETIEPDRPDVTNGTHIVSTGVLQVEAGFQHARPGSGDRSTGTPIGVRLGLFSWLEARISTDGYLYQSSDGSSVSGAGNVQEKSPSL